MHREPLPPHLPKPPSDPVPTGLSAAEVYRRLPSATDFEYGKWEHQRTITVGSDWTQVWTKNQQTLKMAWRLWKWELQNLAPMLMASCRSHGKHVVSHYAGQALQELGLRWPQEHLLDPQRWMPLLRETLGIRTRLIRR